MLGTESLGFQGGGLGILAQIVEPPLQPHGGALRGIEIGVELVGQVSLAIGSGDGAGELRVMRIERRVDDQAATNPLDVKTVLQQGGRTWSRRDSLDRVGGWLGRPEIEPVDDCALTRALTQPPARPAGS